jgi:hypothetical protein
MLHDPASEPATAAMDLIDFSKMWGIGSTLAPRETREWHPIISLAAGRKPGGMETDGGFRH